MARKRSRMGLDHRRRDKGGEIRHKSGKTRVGSLRKTYGPGFAKKYRADMHLHTLLKRSRCESPRLPQEAPSVSEARHFSWIRTGKASTCDHFF